MEIRLTKVIHNASFLFRYRKCMYVWSVASFKIQLSQAICYEYMSQSSIVIGYFITLITSAQLSFLKTPPLIMAPWFSLVVSTQPLTIANKRLGFWIYSTSQEICKWSEPCRALLWLLNWRLYPYPSVASCHWQWHCSARETTMKNMGKCIIWLQVNLVI